MKKVVFREYIAIWVPYATVLTIAAVSWVTYAWDSLDIVGATWLAFGVAAFLLLAVLGQGLLFWKTDIAELGLADGRVEARVARWAGGGKRLKFAPSEATGWRWFDARASGSTSKPSLKLAFTYGGTEYVLPLKDAELIDLAGLAVLAPDVIADLRAKHPEDAKDMPAI